MYFKALTLRGEVFMNFAAVHLASLSLHCLSLYHTLNRHTDIWKRGWKRWLVISHVTNCAGHGTETRLHVDGCVNLLKAMERTLSSFSSQRGKSLIVSAISACCSSFRAELSPNPPGCTDEALA